ncbi:MAG: hypothetical protein ACK4RK_20550 [Gemmataceae bacterium]
MNQEVQPVVLELAPLPREQLGPFLLLGVERDASAEQIEAGWAQHVIWARQRRIATPLEDINWARQVLRDVERRIEADGASLHLDTSARVLLQLGERYHLGQGPSWPPWDAEQDLATYVPEVALPRSEEVRARLRIPEVPLEFPVVARLLAELATAPVDPWNLPLAADGRQDHAP